ncbi:MAG TPA: ABC transporter permease [Firmicutes bacterium]|nr:ABC transporter permease [Bacillota bacterium]
MKKEHVFSILCLMGSYEYLSIVVDKPIVLPRSLAIFEALVEIIISSEFLFIVWATVARTWLAFGLMIILSLGLGVLAGYHKGVRLFLEPVVTFVRSVPTISVMIIFLMWFGRDVGPIYIISFVVFPILYEFVLGAFSMVSDELVDVCHLFGSRGVEKFKALYYPHLLFQLRGGIKATLGLAFKVSVMSEVLAQTPRGIGQALNVEKTYLNMAGVFAWTLILIALVWGFEQLLQKVMKSNFFES